MAISYAKTWAKVAYTNKVLGPGSIPQFMTQYKCVVKFIFTSIKKVYEV